MNMNGQSNVHECALLHSNSMYYFTSSPVCCPFFLCLFLISGPASPAQT